ncbi:MAG: hypothetical protein ACR2FY_18440 [Pirellulaceae bacterium]
MSPRASDWMFYLAPEAWERYKLLDMHDDLKQTQREASHARARATDTVETLQENLSRALLLVHSLTETLVRKGLVTRKEITAVADQLDMLDGRADGKLAPGTVAGTVKEPERPLSPQEFLGKLEKS